METMTNTPAMSTIPATPTAVPPIKLLLTVKETMAALSLSRGSVHALTSSGQLFSIKYGGRRLIPVSALIEFVERLSALQKVS